MRKILNGFLGAAVVVLACSSLASADSFVLNGTASFSGQGFGTIYTLLSLHNNGTETGAVAPSSANNQTTLSTFGTCSGSPTELCGAADNQSEVITTANLATLGITGSSNFGLLYNVNQQGSDPNTYLNAPNPFTVYFYDSTGALLFSASYGGTTNPFPPVGTNGQGTAGYLFELSPGTMFDTDFSSIAYIGMSGTVGNSNDGADDWSIGNTGGAAPVPEPGTLAMFGTGALTLAGFLRRKLLS